MLSNLHRHQTVRQFIKFATVGLGNTILDWVVFSIFNLFLSQFGQLGRQAAKAGSYTIASASGFYFNRRWTFRSFDRSIYHQIGRFLVVSLIGLATNNLLFFLATAEVTLALPDIYGLVIATGGTAIWNFTANKFWTFGPGQTRPSAQ